MNIQTQDFLTECFNNAKVRMREHPKTPEQAREELTLIKLSSQAYLERLETGMEITANKLRGKTYRGAA